MAKDKSPTKFTDGFDKMTKIMALTRNRWRVMSLAMTERVSTAEFIEMSLASIRTTAQSSFKTIMIRISASVTQNYLVRIISEVMNVMKQKVVDTPKPPSQVRACLGHFSLCLHCRKSL